MSQAEETLGSPEPDITVVPDTIDLRDSHTDLGRVALVHEWLDVRAGSEILFEQMAAVFPEADIFALTANKPDDQFDFGGRPVRTTLLDKVPKLRDSRPLQLPLMPPAWKSIRRDPYDVVISSTHAFGREFVRPTDGLHLNYVHAPMRYAWTPELDGRSGRAGFASSTARAVLQRRDLASVELVDSFAANSRAVADRIERFYEREARVIHPPVDVEYFSAIEPNKQGYLLSASRMIPYKRMDLSIHVAAELDMPLVIAGTGPCEAELRELADRIHPSGVTFEIAPPRDRLRELMANAEVFLFPAHEDFGIIMVEALAAGTPVVGLDAGGTADIVADEGAGIRAASQAVSHLVNAVEVCISTPRTVEQTRSCSSAFSACQFGRKIEAWALGR